jgi:small conductance mechanosensitive channel
MAIAYSPTFIQGICTLFIGFWIIKKVCNYISMGLKKTHTEDTVNRFLTALVGMGLKAMLILSVASMFGIQTASFIAIFTALAFAVGTALSGNIGHFASGVMLLIFRPYKIGDEITVQNNTGKVLEIHIFNTSIVTADNRKIIIPNGVITNGVITNFSHQARIQINIPFWVANDTDFEAAKKIINSVADSCPMSLKEEECNVFTNSCSKNGLEIFVRTWCHPNHAPAVHFYFQEHVRNTFLQHGIHAPR